MRAPRQQSSCVCVCVCTAYNLVGLFSRLRIYIHPTQNTETRSLTLPANVRHKGFHYPIGVIAIISRNKRVSRSWAGEYIIRALFITMYYT